MFDYIYISSVLAVKIKLISMRAAVTTKNTRVSNGSDKT